VKFIGQDFQMLVPE